MNKAEEIYSKLIIDEHNRLVLAVDFDKMQKIIDNLQQRISKAIEYIEEHKEPLHHSFDEPDCDYWIATNPDDLLDILRGDDNEK